MRVLVAGADGYLGWPTAMHFAARGHEVYAVDNYLRRRIALETRSEPLLPNPNLGARGEIFSTVTGYTIETEVGDLCDYRVVERIFRDFQPDVVIHYAEQPSAPYSMISRDSAHLTLNNNLTTTFNLLWAVMEHRPDCHVVKLGTMGEYGTPNIDIEEGWIEIQHKGRSDTFLFPRQAGSLYHTTKVLDTDLIWFYVRMCDLRVTDLMQGPVYGILTDESSLDVRLSPNFHYDDIFGTVVNRFLAQAVAGMPLTVYGCGGQTRGYLNLLDTMQCVELAVNEPPTRGQLRILNQFTETFSVNELANRVRRAAGTLGLTVEVRNLPNPRKEAEDHYYNPVSKGLIDLGLEPHHMTDKVLVDMLEVLLPHAARIDPKCVLPRVRWS